MNKDIYTAQKTTWARPNDRQLTEFFGDPENFHSGMRITAVIYAVGRFDSEVDNDRGRWDYEWRRPTIRVRVCTQSGYVRSVELVDHALSSTFDDPVKVLWTRPDESPQS